MASELEFVNYKEFVESLPARTVAKSGDKTVVSNSTDGPGSETNDALAQRILENNEAIPYSQTRKGGFLAGEVAVINGALMLANQNIAYNESLDLSKWTRVKSTDFSFKKASTTCVTRGSLSQENFYTYGICQGMHVVVTISGTNWTTESVSSGYAISVVQVYDDEGNVILDLTSNDRPASFDFVVPKGGAYMRARVRGDAGCEVLVVVENAGFVELYQSVGGKQGTDLFENGNINMNSSGNGFADSSSRVRTKTNLYVRVRKGDYVESLVSSGLRMYVNLLKDGESSWTSSGNWYAFANKRYVFNDDGVVALLFRLQPETTVSVEDIMSRMKIVSSCGGFSPGERLMRFVEGAEQADLSDKVRNVEIEGITSSIKYSAVIPVQGNSFVKVDFPETDVAGVSNNFLIRGIFFGSDTTAYYYRNKESGVDTAAATSWTLYIPSGVSAIRVGIRSAQNVKVKVSLRRVEVVRNENVLFKSVAHRGCRALAPQNTLPSFKIAAAVGFRYCEADIRKTSDGYLVCAHDDDISGVSTGTGNISEMTLAQLQSYKFNKGACSYFADTKIATYSDFLKCCKNTGMIPVLDVKVSGIEAQLVSEAKELGILEKVVFVYGYISMLSAIRALAPHSRLGMLLSDVADQNVTDILTVSSKADHSDVFFDVNHSTMTSEGVQRAKNASIPLECWTTGTLPDDYVSGLTMDSVMPLENSVKESELDNLIVINYDAG